MTDGILLSPPRNNHNNANTSDDDNNNKDEKEVILPWIGFGTYKLSKDVAYKTVLMALECGYRCLDTAFIYGGEKTEKLVGQAIHKALEKKILKSREEVFVTTKHWRKYHGYEETLQCLKLSLSRLQLDYVDLYLIHWPGPAWSTMNRRKDLIEENGPWFYAADKCKDPAQMAQLRSDTWRAMEDALKEGKVRAIGVSNFTVKHLEALKKTARIWPPAVNQVEFHPLYPQAELLEYCQKEGIVLQAYASLGGQDTGAKQWQKLSLEAAEDENEMDDTNNSKDDGGSEASPGQASAKKPMGKRKPKQKKLRDSVVSLMSCRPVVSLARELNVTPAQVLLRWALDQKCTVIPKASNKSRMEENAKILSFSLTKEQISKITGRVQADMAKAISDDAPQQGLLTEEDKQILEQAGESAIGRLCWRNDPLRHLDFD